MSRLQWLVSHPEFKRDPVRVMRGVVSWEIHKLLSKNMSLELDGVKLTSRPFDGNGRLICYFGPKFDDIHEFLKIYLKEGMVFVDVGANIGSHAITAARLAGGKGPSMRSRRTLIPIVFCGRISNCIILETLRCGRLASATTSAWCRFSSTRTAPRARSSTGREGCGHPSRRQIGQYDPGRC